MLLVSTRKEKHLSQEAPIVPVYRVTSGLVTPEDAKVCGGTTHMAKAENMDDGSTDSGERRGKRETLLKNTLDFKTLR